MTDVKCPLSDERLAHLNRTVGMNGVVPAELLRTIAREAYLIGHTEGYRTAIDFVASGTEHPVDVLKSCATYMGLKLDTEVESQMRAYCDEPVEACEFGARGHYGG